MTRMYASCLVWLEPRHLFYLTAQVSKEIFASIFGFMDLKCVVNQEIVTYQYPSFGSWFAVLLVNSIYVRFFPQTFIWRLLFNIKPSLSSLSSCKLFVLFRLHIMARPVQLSKRLKFPCISAARLFPSE